MPYVTVPYPNRLAATMLPTRTLPLPLALLPLLFVQPRAAETIRFAPAAGTSLERSYELRGEYRTSMFEVDVSGMEIEVPEVELGATWTRRVVVTDELEELREGAPAALVRSYDALEHELEYAIDISGRDMNHEEEGEVESQSLLEGESVRFTWDPEKEVYTRRLLDEDGDVDLLEGLEEDMDLRGFLPEEPVEVGDTWFVEPSALVKALLPGGELALSLGRGQAARGPELAAGGIEPRMAGGLEGMLGAPTERSEVRARLDELREEDGRRLAVIALEAELVTVAPKRELYERWMREYEPDDASTTTELERADVTFEATLRGELLWDLGAGHARSLRLAGDSLVTLERDVAVVLDGQPVEVALELEMEGELEISARFE